MFNEKILEEKIYILLDTKLENITKLTIEIEKYSKNFIPDSQAYEFAVAIDEFVTNVISHGKIRRNIIIISIFFKNNEMIAVIKDWSDRFIPPLVVDKKKFSFDKLEAGGLGLFLIQEFVDEVRFLYDEKTNANLTVMKKYVF
ncbi:MAG TPA: ATP-binding protein [Spirochaetota bacterium]|nr:ATP-binding protein [Spirochaetota bacterium]HOM37886.1 ATP-binding protein [Spirochaetota bacterium]HPQ48690.1 ATP-binding protein [Spirochaetota bacterium]